MLKVVVVTLCHRSWKSVDIQAFLSMYECMLIVMNISIWRVLQLHYCAWLTEKYIKDFAVITTES